MRIAIASRNRKELDTHLGKSNSIYIYEFDENKNTSEFFEHRTIDIDLESKHQSQKILKALKDCDCVITMKHGPKSGIYAKELNIRLVEDEGLIEEVLKRYTNHVIFMKNVKI